MSSSLRGMGDEVMVKKFSYNILDDIRREQIPPNIFMSRSKPPQVLLILIVLSTRLHTNPNL